MKGRFMLVAALCLLVLVPMAQAKDKKLCCQEITFRFGESEYTIVDAQDLDAVSVEEINRAIIYLGSIRGSEGNQELKIEIFKRLAPNLFRRHFETREKDLCR